MSAAISLKEALQESATSFESSHPGTKVVFNFAASGQLAQQIAQGAPADLFISASADQVKDLLKQGLIAPESVHDFAGNSLVVMSAKDRSFSDIDDLRKVERLAIGNPKTVPAGAYAVEALQKAGLYDELSSAHKLVLAEDARQILAYVEGGDVDAGMVYNTDALLARKAKVSFAVPRSYTKPMVYELALVSKGAHRALAEEFRHFLLADETKKIFVRRGFST